MILKARATAARTSHEGGLPNCMLACTGQPLLDGCQFRAIFLTDAAQPIARKLEARLVVHLPDGRRIACADDGHAMMDFGSLTGPEIVESGGQPISPI